MPVDWGVVGAVAKGAGAAWSGVRSSLGGWKKLRAWMARRRSRSSIPSQTLVVLESVGPSGAPDFWWHTGSIGGAPAMQICGILQVTNVTDSDVFLNSVRLSQPKASTRPLIGQESRKILTTKGAIPAKGMVRLHFHMMVPGLVRQAGETHASDVAVIDQFGNEHWVRKIVFPYR